MGEAYADAIEGARLVTDEPGRSPVAWQGSQLSKVIADLAGAVGAGVSASSAGYSGTPLVRKLGIKPGARLGLIGAPDGFDHDARRAAARTWRSAAACEGRST